MVYSGRTEDLVGPLIEQFSAETGIEVDVRYGDSTELAATIRLEGDNTPADVFLAQDPASLGAVALADALAPLPEDLVAIVPERFSDPERHWVGISGRARTVVVNPDVSRRYPASGVDLGSHRSRCTPGIGIAPTNGSFLAFVAAMILEQGEDRTLEWLEGIAANQPTDFPTNSPIVEAVDSGEIAARARQPLLPPPAPRRAGLGDGRQSLPHRRRRRVPRDAIRCRDPRSIRTRRPSRVASFDSCSPKPPSEHFATETFEYPLLDGIEPDPSLIPLDDLEHARHRPLPVGRSTRPSHGARDRRRA